MNFIERTIGLFTKPNETIENYVENFNESKRLTNFVIILTIFICSATLVRMNQFDAISTTNIIYFILSIVGAPYISFFIFNFVGNKVGKTEITIGKNIMIKVHIGISILLALLIPMAILAVTIGIEKVNFLNYIVHAYVIYINAILFQTLYKITSFKKCLLIAIMFFLLTRITALPMKNLNEELRAKAIISTNENVNK